MKRWSQNIQTILAVALFAGIIGYIFTNTIDDPKYYLILNEKSLLLEGIWTTLYVSVVTLVLSMIFGFVLFLMMDSRIAFIKAVAMLFKEIMMGTPLLVMVFLTVYVFGPMIQLQDKLLLGILALTLYTSPYLANSYRTAVEVVDEDQYTVMNLYNFSAYQKYRYVILPQMIKPMIPSFINGLSSTIKGSALLKVVSVTEISYVITLISQKNWASIEGYLVMWVVYLLITIPLSLLAQRIGKEISH